jgi:hypothetical protein
LNPFKRIAKITSTRKEAIVPAGIFTEIGKGERRVLFTWRRRKERDERKETDAMDLFLRVRRRV